MKRVKHIIKEPNSLLMILLGIWFVLNILQGIFTELANDEAYYWVISQKLSWGYFDHPPLFGLLTWLGINTIGNSEIGVRFFTILMQPLYLYLFWTIVRTDKSDWKSALLYFLTAFSIPQLQLYGWVVTPDAPLLMGTAALLWSYKRFSEKQDISSILLLGASFALIAYAKYQGAIVVLFLVAANIKLLRQWRFWIAAGVAALLFLPHIMWQYSHDWVSFRYHLSERNGVFAWGDVFEFILNIIGTFNPFIFIPVAIYLYKQKARDSMERTLRFIFWGFLGFFLLSSLRGYVQPQWVIPIVFTIIYTAVRSAEKYARFQKYLLRVGFITSALFVVVRVASMCYSGDFIKFEVFNNREAYGKLADEMDGRPLIFDGFYAQASKMNYYSNGQAIAYPSMYRRSSHYQMMDMDEKLYGQRVAVSVTDVARARHSDAKVDSLYKHFKIDNSMGFYYDTIDFFIPTRRVEMKYTGLPTNTLTDRPVAMNIEIYNPYEYDIPLADFELVAQFKMSRFYMKDVVIPWKGLKVLEAGSRHTMKVEFTVPVVNTGKYKFGLSLQRPPMTSWYNSPRAEVFITNPAQKRGR